MISGAFIHPSIGDNISYSVFHSRSSGRDSQMVACIYNYLDKLLCLYIMFVRSRTCLQNHIIWISNYNYALQSIDDTKADLDAIWYSKNSNTQIFSLIFKHLLTTLYLWTANCWAHSVVRISRRSSEPQIEGSKPSGPVQMWVVSGRRLWISLIAFLSRSR